MRRAVILAILCTGGLMAASGAAEDKSSSWIRVQQLALGGSMAAPRGSKLGWIEIQGWDWEVEPADKVDSFTVKQGVKPAGTGMNDWLLDHASEGGSPARPVGTYNLTMKRGTSPAGTRPPPPPPPPDLDLDYDEGDTGTHETPARRASETITVAGGRTENPSPPDKFGRVKVKFAWEGCARGQRLGLVELRDGRTLYRLEDVTVAACATDGATLRYARLSRSRAR